MSHPSSADHWGFYRLPPFFSVQPAPAAVERQKTLWAKLILDHAVHYSQRGSADSNAVLRFYSTSSDIFANSAINKRMGPDGAREMLEALVAQHPNNAVVVSDGSAAEYAVLVAANDGGLKALEESLLAWLLEMGQGTTTAMLAKKGAVMTFDELAEQRALQYKLKPVRYAPRTSSEEPLCRDMGALTEEQAIRTFLQALNHRPVSVLRPFKITLFNLDGSEAQPYQGVKFGGE